MKTVKRLLAVIFLIMAFGGVSAQKNSQEMTVPLSEPGKPVTLECGLMHGSLNVTGYDGKEVIVTVFVDSTKEDADDDDDNRGGMKRINFPVGMDVRVEEHDNTVRINTGMERNIAALKIMVPHNTGRINVSTTMGGEITVTNVSGKVEISNLNGNITATGISGSVVANGLNGSIVVSMKSLDPSAAMAFSSMNGKIDLTLPADTKANLKLKSENGKVYSDFDVAVDKGTPKVETKNEDHFHEIKLDDWVYGKINGGGPEIMIQNQYGSIFIRKAK